MLTSQTPVSVQSEVEGSIEPASVSSQAAFASAVPAYPEAVLEKVVFTAAGVDQTKPALSSPSRPAGTVTGRSVNLREGPGTNFTIADRAFEGDALQVTGERDGIWFEVVSANTGQRVWIHGNFFNAPKDSNGAVLAQN